MMSLRALTWVVPCSAVLAAVLGGGFALEAERVAGDRQALADGSRIAELAARMLDTVRDLPREAEDLVGDQLVAQATIADQLVAVTDGVKGESVNNRLQAATSSGNPLGILVTDANGKVLFRHRPTPDVTFGTDGMPAAHGRAIGALIAGTPSPAISPVERSAANGLIVKQAAIRGSRGRLVQVTADVSGLATIAMAAGGGRVIEDLLASGSADAVWLIGPDGRIVAHNDTAATPLPADGVAPDAVRILARTVMDGHAPAAVADGGGVLAAAPVKGDSAPFGAVVIQRASVVDGILASVVAIALIAVLAGAIVFLFLRSAVRHADAAMTLLAAAAKAVSAGRFNPFTLSELCDRRDPAGEAARAFRTMASDVSAREDGLEVKLLLAGQMPPPQ